MGGGWLISFRTRTVRTNAYGSRQRKAVRTRSSRLGLDPCSVSRVACAQSSFFGGSGWQDDFPGFSFGGVTLYQASSIFRNVGVFCSYKFSIKTARLATTLGSLCRDWFGVHCHPSLGALRAVCRESGCMCRVECDTFFLKKKEAAGPNCLGATLSLRTRVRASGKRFSLPFSFACLFLIFPFFFQIKILKNVSCEYGRWVVETQLCKLRDTSDTLIGRACAKFHL